MKAVYYCPHRADENCDCRKPKPGMLLRAADEFGVDLSESYLIGDHITDIQAGAKVGCTTILVKTGRSREYLEEPGFGSAKPDHIASDLPEAIELVLKMDVE